MGGEKSVVNEITKQKIVRDLSQLGVKKGDLLNIKASLKSIGYVKGGANTLIEALLDVVGEEGTLVTDSFVHVVPFPEKKIWNSNIVNDKTVSYAGAVANAMIQHPKSERSKHPIQKFSAIGKMAKELMENHTANSYAYDVLRVMSEIGGKNLKIGTDEKVVGVGTTHVAVGLLGFRNNRKRVGVKYLDDQGIERIFERDWAGLCVNGLINFIPEYRKVKGAIVSEGMVGQSVAKITDMKTTLEIELAILKKNPRFFMCTDSDCIDCRHNWLFSEKKVARDIWKHIKERNFKEVAMILYYNRLRNYLPIDTQKIPPFNGKFYY